MVSLGDLLRATGLFTDTTPLTHAHDGIIANDHQVADAKMFALKEKDEVFWLIKILSKDNRIPETPYDDEEVDT